MAGGFDWLRLYHGTAQDPKLGLIARKAKARRADVLALWIVVLEAASANEAERGCVGNLDFESIDYMLDFDEGQARAIYVLMQERGLVDSDGGISNWTKRQPKRERDDNSTDRVRAHRQRKAAEGQTKDDESGSETSTNETPGNASETHMERHETPRNTTGSQETPRGEESRGDTLSPLPAGARAHAQESDPARPVPTASPAGLICRALHRAGVVATNPGHASLLDLISDGVTQEYIEAVAKNCVSKGHASFAYVLATAKARWSENKPAVEPPHQLGGKRRSEASYGTRMQAKADLLTGRQADSIDIEPATVVQAQPGVLQ